MRDTMLKVKEIVAEQVGMYPDDIKLAQNLRDDLGADSLDEVEIVMACEDEFGIEIPDELAERCKTVEDIIDLINEIG